MTFTAAQGLAIVATFFGGVSCGVVYSYLIRGS